MKFGYETYYPSDVPRLCVRLARARSQREEVNELKEVQKVLNKAQEMLSGQHDAFGKYAMEKEFALQAEARGLVVIVSWLEKVQGNIQEVKLFIKERLKTCLAFLKKELESRNCGILLDEEIALAKYYEEQEKKELN